MNEEQYESGIETKAVKTRRYAVIESDNYDGDFPGETFAGPLWIEKDKAEAIAKACNDAVHERHDRYWRVVELPYKLREGFEP